MITLLDTVGPAIWRASWQAAALAALIIVILRCCGDRLSPRWRFLLLSVVLARLLFVVTPGSPWSAFNLVRWNHETSVAPIAPDAVFVSEDSISGSDHTTVVAPSLANAVPSIPAIGQPQNPPVTSVKKTGTTVTFAHLWTGNFIARGLTAIWLAGCLVLGIRLLVAALHLRRRLSACRPVTDGALLNLLETCCRRVGIKQPPALLVTPEAFSPCIVGPWHPRILLPESVVTESSTTRLSHVLSHELAHLVRGDLWTNWLLLAVRVLHWFNPMAWWTVREMQAEREAACDELAFAALGEVDRSDYASTIVELAASLTPSAMAPGLIGLFSSRCRLQGRVERLLRSSCVTTWRWPTAASLLTIVALMGLTDALPNARAQAPKNRAAGPNNETVAKGHTVSGRCVHQADNSPAAGVVIKLYEVEGLTAAPVEIAKTVTDVDGQYSFSDLVPERPEHHLDHLSYGVLAFVNGRPTGMVVFHLVNNKKVVTIRLAKEKSTLAGRVIDMEGRPVAGATIARFWIEDRPIPGLLPATTDADGRFKFDDVGVHQWFDGKPAITNFYVIHPDHPVTLSEAKALPADVLVALPSGCVVTGTARDAAGQPVAGAVVTARRTDKWGETYCVADATGRFRIVVPEGKYDFTAETENRVSIAQTGRECLADQKVELPSFTMTGGGLISGQVINTVTGQPVITAESGGFVALGLFGPSRPMGTTISPRRLATVDKAGRFTLRAAPGENFPYLVNTHGERMAWDTQQQPPVIVKEGQTTSYNMLITPEIPPAERLKAAREVVAALPKSPVERTAQILVEFRKLNRTIDETELWCMLMRELVGVGRDAVPQLCAELDQTTENRMLRRLGFALRAIGDARAVPALIRAVPKTLQPGCSDYGLIVADAELTAFMQTHDLAAGGGGQYFDVGRPVREIFGALHALTKQNFDDGEIFSISLSEDPRRQILQRRMYNRQAERWQAWWEANWRKFTADATYQKVNLSQAEELLPAVPAGLGKSARVVGVLSRAVVSPAIQKGEYAWHFLDLDTGYQPKWPADIPQNESSLDSPQLADWAAKSGADLMCVTRRSATGAETFVLKALGMQVREITARESRNLESLIAAGTLPEGRPVNELLMHYDADLEELVPDANGTFIFITRDGSMGVIEVTDRVTRAADVTGAISPLPGVGFHKGVRFDLKEIIP